MSSFQSSEFSPQLTGQLVSSSINNCNLVIWLLLVTMDPKGNFSPTISMYLKKAKGKQHKLDNFLSIVKWIVN